MTMNREYGTGGEASMQGDVYSFGILVLEMFTGRAPVDEIFKDGVNLHSYASRVLPDQVMQILDPILLSELDEPTGDNNNSTNKRQRNKLLECMVAIIGIGVVCSVASPWERMDMRNVTKELHSIRVSFLDAGFHGE